MCVILVAGLLTTACSDSTRRVWVTMSAEQGETDTIVEVYIDGDMVCNIENLAEFTSPDKARQVGYFPLTDGKHTIEVKADGYEPLEKTLRIITGEEGVQNLHLYLERE